jgi:hypothetical protein
MGLKLLVCPAHTPTAGTRNEPSHCLTACPHRCISPMLLAGMLSSSARNHHRGKLISVSSLSSEGCPRALMLERTLDYADEAQSMLYAYRGTVLHQVLEDAHGFALPDGSSLLSLGFIQEYRMLIAFCFEHGGFEAPAGSDPYDPGTWDSVTCPGCALAGVPRSAQEFFFLSGTLDCAEPRWDTYDPADGSVRVTIWDLKTVAEYQVDKIVSGAAAKESRYGAGTKDSHCEQLNLYAYLLDRSPIPEPVLEVARARGLELRRLVVDDLRIQLFSMNKFPVTGGTTLHRAHWKHPWQTVQVPGIPRLSDAWAVDHVRRVGRPIYEALILEQGRGGICPPAPNSKGAHSWRCGGFCAFAGSDYCPDPATEWAALESGQGREEAFQAALAARDGEDEREVA